MSTQALRDLFTADQRRDVQFSGVDRDELPYGVRLREQTGAFNQIVYTELNTETADAAITEQIDFYRKRGQRFEWKYFDYDQPEDMLDRLRTHGFEIGNAEAALVLDLETAPPALFDTHGLDIRKITDPDQIHHDLSIQSRVFGGVDEVKDERDNPTADQVVNEMRNCTDSVSVYAVYIDGIAVSAAWLRFSIGSQFGSLWGGATLPAYRKRGAYSALLAARASEVRARGRRYLTVDASPMSRPILEKRGFQCIGFSYPCEWSP